MTNIIRTCISFKSMCSYLLFLNFFVQNIFVSLYKRLLEPTWKTLSACVLVLDHLYEDFRCSIITDFMSIMLGFSNVFGS